MEMKQVKSSNIEAIGYDPDKSELRIDFGTAIYSYECVPPEIYHSMMKAGSVGKFFFAKIKGKFVFKKLKFETEKK